MTQKSFFAEVVRIIETAGISYMVTGSFASSYHGEPRASNDADIILSKLEWAKKGQSQLQFRDALGVASIQYRQLDKDYLRKWAKDLKIDQLLNALFEQARLLQPPT